jgi:hypothetical protein
MSQRKNRLGAIGTVAVIGPSDLVIISPQLRDRPVSHFPKGYLSDPQEKHFYRNIIPSS